MFSTCTQGSILPLVTRFIIPALYVFHYTSLKELVHTLYLDTFNDMCVVLVLTYSTNRELLTIPI